MGNAGKKKKMESPSSPTAAMEQPSFSSFKIQLLSFLSQFQDLRVRTAPSSPSILYNLMFTPPPPPSFFVWFFLIEQTLGRRAAGERGDWDRKSGPCFLIFFFLGCNWDFVLIVVILLFGMRCSWGSRRRWNWGRRFGSCGRSWELVKNRSGSSKERWVWFLFRSDICCWGAVWQIDVLDCAFVEFVGWISLETTQTQFRYHGGVWYGNPVYGVFVDPKSRISVKNSPNKWGIWK